MTKIIFAISFFSEFFLQCLQFMKYFNSWKKRLKPATSTCASLCVTLSCVDSRRFKTKLNGTFFISKLMSIDYQAALRGYDSPNRIPLTLCSCGILIFTPHVSNTPPNPRWKRAVRWLAVHKQRRSHSSLRKPKHDRVSFSPSCVLICFCE